MTFIMLIVNFICILFPLFRIMWRICKILKKFMMAPHRTCVLILFCENENRNVIFKSYAVNFVHMLIKSYKPSPHTSIQICICMSNIVRIILSVERMCDCTKMSHSHSNVHFNNPQNKCFPGIKQFFFFIEFEIVIPFLP